MNENKQLNAWMKNVRAVEIVAVERIPNESRSADQRAVPLSILRSRAPKDRLCPV